MNEWDVVCSIFQKKITCDDSIKNAISWESRKMWHVARELYKTVLEQDLTEDMKDFSLEAYFR